jgi:hypothetical protein
MCLRKKVEDALGKTQFAACEHQLRRQKLEFAMGAIKMEYSLLVHAFSKIKADRQMRERQDILNRAKAREPNAWAPGAFSFIPSQTFKRTARRAS